MKRHGLFIKLWSCVCAALFAYGLFNSADASYEQGWRSADYVQARIISESAAIGEGEGVTVNGAIEVRLSDGWHAYWRMPGEGGLPPRFNWDESENLASVNIKWPAPNRYQTLDMYSFGYKNDVMLPFTAVATDAAAEMKLRLKADIMVCKDICVPQHLMMALDIPAGAQTFTMDSARIQKAVKDLPFQENRPNLHIDNVVIGPKALVVNVFAQRGYDQADLFVESGDLYMTAPPVIEQDEDDPRKALIKIFAPNDVENLFDEIGHGVLTLTFTDGTDSIERTFDFTQ